MSDCNVTSFAKRLYQKALLNRCSEAKHESTRTRILETAFDEIYEHGFQGMRIETILKKTKLAKGALYHHFPSKKLLGYAVVDEFLLASQQEQLKSLMATDDPVLAICRLLEDFINEATEDEIALGCPLSKLTQEMANLDDGFKTRLSVIYEHWQSTLSGALKRGQAASNVRDDLDADIVATFIISSMHGISGTAQCMQSRALLDKLASTLCDYLQTLRP